jgi:hypothetical protein
MNSKLTEVLCEYTGGGIYVFTAKYNDEVYLATDFEMYGTYDIPWQQIDDSCDFDYDGHWKDASIPLPTWGDILQAIRKSYEDGVSQNMDMDEVEHQILRLHPKLFRRIDENDSTPRNNDEDNCKRLETLSLFIEEFEEFLEERGIDIPNSEKDDDPDASTIYGTDYGELSDRIESLLIRLGMM